MDQLDAYLDELVSHLDCDPLRRDEIRLEVHAHLRELYEQELAAGRGSQAAQDAAIAAFGPAVQVATRLTSANRGRITDPGDVPVTRRVGAVALAWAVCLAASTGAWAWQASYSDVVSGPVVFWLVYLGSQLLVGVLASFLVWRLSRRPWDSLVLPLALALTIFAASPYGAGDEAPPQRLVNLLMLDALPALVGAAAMAAYAHRRVRASTPRAE